MQKRNKETWKGMEMADVADEMRKEGSEKGGGCFHRGRPAMLCSTICWVFKVKGTRKHGRAWWQLPPAMLKEESEEEGGWFYGPGQRCTFQKNRVREGRTCTDLSCIHSSQSVRINRNTEEGKEEGRKNVGRACHWRCLSQHSLAFNTLHSFFSEAMGKEKLTELPWLGIHVPIVIHFET